MTHVSILNLAVAVSLLVLVLPALVMGPPLLPQPFREPLCKRVPAVQILFYSTYFLATVSVDHHPGCWPPRGPAPGPGTPSWTKISLCLGRGHHHGALAVVHSNQLQATSCRLSSPKPERAWFKAASTCWSWALRYPLCALCGPASSAVGPATSLHNQSSGQGRAEDTSLVLAVLAMGLLCGTPFQLASLVTLSAHLPQPSLAVRVSCAITGLQPRS